MPYRARLPYFILNLSGRRHRSRNIGWDYSPTALNEELDYTQSAGGPGKGPVVGVCYASCVSDAAVTRADAFGSGFPRHAPWTRRRSAQSGSPGTARLA